MTPEDCRQDEKLERACLDENNYGLEDQNIWLHVELNRHKSTGLTLGIDASNIRTGGGVTHLEEVLRAASPSAQGFAKVIVWASQATLARIEDRPWLTKRSSPVLEGHYLRRALWQHNCLGVFARTEGCNLLFAPGGSFATDFRPVVTMSRNLLPFEWKELRRYGWNLHTLKFLLLRWIQGRSFRKANGVIFLTAYARNAVLEVTGTLQGECMIIPHGINPRFTKPPRTQRLFTDFTKAQPCRVLYVSIVDMYKHQWQVAEAVAKLRSEDIPIVLELVGPPAGGMNQLKETLHRVDPKETFITYRGAVPYEKLDAIYASADIGIFASSCENMPNILLEGMGAGLPMACSRMGPMPEILGDAGIYFDPEDAHSIARALRELIESPMLRAELAQAGFNRARTFSWTRCANETFGFLARIAHEASTGRGGNL
ncbi:glycosyltransferase family 4 protein [Nitrospira lenta]|uniref:Glycosyltransferase n=1 Tax=Nitrospira lenta TaxID=1436998 RepID=A0A330L8E1_9BACT|nr:glycosyltransferase family 1 protein [Nitrospira lenta]SPP66210.1 Glycosyltransferase [Nitrospira lenta]